MREKSLLTLNAVLLVVVLVTAMTPSARAQSTYKSLYTFTGDKDGGAPDASLISDHAGNLYGTTYDGGAHDGGTVFELTANGGSWKESVLYNFCSLANCADGGNPTANLIFDSAGNLYGTTAYGGASRSEGTVFKLTPSAGGGWTESVLYVFCSHFHCDDGAEPTAGLIFDAAGNLYGTTFEGGTYGDGTVFRLSPSVNASWNEKVLHHFTGGSDGAYPYAGLIFDKVGNLYGTAVDGGNLACNHGLGCGTAFQLIPNANGSWKEKVLHKFDDGEEGSDPYGGLIFDTAGNLYGTTGYGGTFCGGMGCGAVYQLTPSVNGSWKSAALHRFRGGTDGGRPYGGVIADASGNLYGTTEYGGNGNDCFLGCGVVYKLIPDGGGWTTTTIHYFTGRKAVYPQAGLIFDQAGNLYGTTAGDGRTSFGSVFEITP